MKFLGLKHAQKVTELAPKSEFYLNKNTAFHGQSKCNLPISPVQNPRTCWAREENAHLIYAGATFGHMAQILPCLWCHRPAHFISAPVPGKKVAGDLTGKQAPGGWETAGHTFQALCGVLWVLFWLSLLQVHDVIRQRAVWRMSAVWRTSNLDSNLARIFLRSSRRSCV